MNSGVYAIVNMVNDNCYIGSSWNIPIRFSKHLSLLNAGKHHSPHLQHAWNLYGANNFEFAIVLLCDPQNVLLYEQLYIDLMMPEYNVCVTAGSKAGIPRTDETKRKLALANTGKKQSEETKRKISESLKGCARSEETKKKISISHVGVLKGPHTEEAKKRISQAQKGKPLSEKNKQGISSAMMGNQNTLGKHWKWKKNTDA